MGQNSIGTVHIFAMVTQLNKIAPVQIKYRR